ncbi:MAG: hypothetical protein IPF92_19305 [Myxococcales bacterium]|nr:hypothetical protein [Myxococcales bacterium]
MWDLDLDAIGNGPKRAAIHAWRERVLAVQRACTVMACPPSLDDLLWTHGHGDALDAFLHRGNREAGTFFQVDSDALFNIILSEPA